MSQSRVVSSFMVLFMLAGIIAIRFFEADLFYDPLNKYFHGNFQALPVPEMTMWKLVLSNSLRFLLNSTFSLGILWFLYKSVAFVKAGSWVYLFAFIILSIGILLLLQMDSSLAKMTLFYTRRFLIHPILLFILVAGCYYLNIKTKES
ncbi:exosortase F system-associated membrane protein [Nonlabens antarcticus]|uniref:exosortase F system-associated membrane protein n=1 Tax=Nonlabens antarcticus TaxID=392714 RepID=UPI0018919F2B|nr:exosortase F system-associated protein [Nonlabens antarcticus]